jgi:DNA-binding transcriptional MerR regulator
VTDRPRYRINVVSEQTGVPEATLRAWERRYQVPKPERTPSGYRIYSRDDVAQVQQIRSLCEQGMSPAEAAKQVALRRVEHAAAQEPLDQAAEGADAAFELRFVEDFRFEARNAAGIASLGDVVRVMDKAAVLAASRFSSRPCVVVSSQSLSIDAAVRNGQMLEIVAQVVQAGPLAMNLRISCYRTDLVGSQELVCQARFVVVPAEQ